MIKLRNAFSEDYTGISKLHADSWQISYRGILSDDFLDNRVHQTLEATWLNRLKSPAENQHTIIAIKDNVMAGFACIFFNDDEVYGSLMDNLHVSLGSQNQGIGKMLVKNCAETICNNTDNHKMYLWVYEANEKARNVYSRLGGTTNETIEKPNMDGTTAFVCRYIWEDVALII